MQSRDWNLRHETRAAGVSALGSRPTTPYGKNLRTLIRHSITIGSRSSNIPAHRMHNWHFVHVSTRFSAYKLKFHGTVFRVASSWHPREVDRACVSGMSDDFPVQFATRLPDWSAGGLLRCSAARLSECRSRSPKSMSTTRRRPWEDPRSILVQFYNKFSFVTLA